MTTDNTTPDVSRTRRRLVAPAAIAAAVIGGAFGGAALGFPGISSAQDETTTTTPDTSDDATTDSTTTDDATTDEAGCEDGFGGRGGFGHHVGLATAAETLGLTEDELRTQLQDGASLADVAAAQGVDVQVLIDALVAEAQAHLDEEVAEGDLDQAQADELAATLTEGITARVNGEASAFGGPGFGGPGMGGRGHHFHGDADTDDATTDDATTESSVGVGGGSGSLGA